MGLLGDVVQAVTGGMAEGPVGAALGTAARRRKRRTDPSGDLKEPMSVEYDTGSNSNNDETVYHPMVLVDAIRQIDRTHSSRERDRGRDVKRASRNTAPAC